MPITDLPTQTEDAGQLGQAKANATPYTDPTTQQSAEQWNALVERVIQLFQEVGLSDGSTVGSLREAIMAAGGGSSPSGSVYWEWNGTTTSQFGAALDYKGDFGLAPTGGSVLSVVAAPFGPPGAMALRLTATGVGGGFFHPILDLPGNVLPSRYVVEFMYVGTTLAGGELSFILCASETTGTLDGLGYSVEVGGTNNLLSQIYNDERDAAPTLFSATSLSAAVLSRGKRYRAEVWRQAGSNPQAWHVAMRALDDSAGPTQGSASSASDGTSTGSRFAGKDMHLVGPGVFTGGATMTGTVDLMGLRIISLD